MFLLVSLLINDILSNSEANAHFNKGIQLFASSEYTKAISAFNKAIELEPRNTTYIFRRMITFRAIKQHKAMMRDLDDLLFINPHQKTALTYRAELNTKQGNLKEAKDDYIQLKSIGESVDENIKLIGEIEAAVSSAYKAFSQNQNDAVIKLLEMPIKNCPFSVPLYELRAKSYTIKKELNKVITDCRQIVALKPEDVDSVLRLSLLIYETGDSEQSLKEIKTCFRMDPDNQACMPHYRLVKKLEKSWKSIYEAKSNSDWDTCVMTTKSQIMLPNYNEAVRMLGNELLCLCQSKNAQTAQDAVISCSYVLENDPNMVAALFNRGEAHLLLANFDEAEHDLEQVSKKHANYEGVQEALQRCQKMRKQASKRDYYKILELPRTASKADIVKAYRTMAKIWHPDRYSGDDKKMAEEKFKHIADAKQVLSNADMRKKFDSGIDPLDEDAKGNDDFHGFHGGFPGGFKFNFQDGQDDFFFNF